MENTDLIANWRSRENECMMTVIRTYAHLYGGRNGYNYGCRAQRRCMVYSGQLDRCRPCLVPRRVCKGIEVGFRSFGGIY